LRLAKISAAFLAWIFSLMRYRWVELAELQLIKERFSKLLLGEDMSGSGKGVSTAVAISNAITNLYGRYA
jgi:hypothetical protein